MEANGHLVLCRKVGEVIDIDPFGLNIEVTVARMKGDKVWLAVRAPRDIPVHRREVTLQAKEVES